MKVFSIASLMILALMTLSSASYARDEAGNIVPGLISILFGGSSGSGDRNPTNYDYFLLRGSKIGSTKYGTLLHGPDKEILARLPAYGLKYIDRGEGVAWQGSGFCDFSPLCQSPYKVSGTLTIIASGYDESSMRLCFKYRSIIRFSHIQDVEDVSGVACYIHNYDFAGYAEVNPKSIDVTWDR